MVILKWQLQQMCRRKQLIDGNEFARGDDRIIIQVLFIIRQIEIGVF